MKWLPYALVLLGLTVGAVLGSELDLYGRSLGVGRVSSVGAILGMVVGAQMPIWLGQLGPIPKHRLWVLGLYVAFLIPLCEAFVGWWVRHDAPFTTYLWLGFLDLALGVLVLLLFLPVGRDLAKRRRSRKNA